MPKINQPSALIKLTNVSLVRLKKGKKRFEIACYQNKVQDYRSGVEKRLDEVLQIPQVFANVSKGQVALQDDITTAFGPGKSIDEVVMEILTKGEIQLGDKERAAAKEKLHNEILTIVLTKCINPRSKKRYPPTMIAKALAGLKVNFSPTKSAKLQALEAIKLLVEKQVIPIARAKMQVRVGVAADKVEAVREPLTKLLGGSEGTAEDGTWTATTYIDPGNYRDLMTLVGGCGGSVEVLDMAVAE